MQFIVRKWYQDSIPWEWVYECFHITNKNNETNNQCKALAQSSEPEVFIYELWHKDLDMQVTLK